MFSLSCGYTCQIYTEIKLKTTSKAVKIFDSLSVVLFFYQLDVQKVLLVLFLTTSW